MEVLRIIPVKVKGHASSRNVNHTSSPRRSLAVGSPPLLVVEVVYDLNLGDLDCDLLTLSVACGRWTGGTVNCVNRRFRPADEVTLFTVFVDCAVVALLTGVSEVPEPELDDDKMWAFRATIFLKN